ncbi:MAG TPA: nucleotide pyrophosphohydrolase [archaeon]|nr:nucleotide pyrophosphohydrolase [archaeon]
MSFKEVQKQVDEWAQQFKDPYFNPLAIVSFLMEEVGEVAREVNQRFGPKKKKATEDTKELGEEIADVMFGLICLANSQKIDLDENFKKMMDKRYNRDAPRYEKK